MSQPFHPPGPAPAEPYDRAPYAQPYAQHPYDQPYQQQPYDQPYAQQPYAQPVRSSDGSGGSGGSGKTLAVIALVVSGLALLVAVGGLALGGLSAMGGGTFDEPPMIGTAPQVVEHQPYPGVQLAGEVQRVLDDYGYDVSDVTCPSTDEVTPDATTVCHGQVDFTSADVTVDFQDGEGHFTLTTD